MFVEEPLQIQRRCCHGRGVHVCEAEVCRGGEGAAREIEAIQHYRTQIFASCVSHRLTCFDRAGIYVGITADEGDIATLQPPYRFWIGAQDQVSLDSELLQDSQIPPGQYLDEPYPKIPSIKIEAGCTRQRVDVIGSVGSGVGNGEDELTVRRCGGGVV